MFEWLANMLIKTPVQGNGCSCCEAKKEQLKKMQQVLLTGDLDIDKSTDNTQQACMCSSSVRSYDEFHSSYHYKL